MYDNYPYKIRIPGTIIVRRGDTLRLKYTQDLETGKITKVIAKVHTPLWYRIKRFVKGFFT